MIIPDVEPGVGAYYFVLQLDYDDQIGDGDPSNNEAIYNQQVLVQGGCVGCHQAPLGRASWLLGIVGLAMSRRRLGGGR